MKERNFRRLGIGDSVPILQALDQLLRARVFGLHNFRSRRQLIREESVGITVRVGLNLQHVLGT